MKKRILSIATALVAFVAVSVSAQTTATTDCSREAKCQSSGICKKDKKECSSPFANLNLTDAQKESLKALKQQCKKECKSDSLKKAYKAQRMENAKSARAEYLANVKKILTPEQYQQFLENAFINGGGHSKGHNKKGMDKPRRDMKDFKAEKRDCKNAGGECKKSKK